jgi:hypothetical protein
MSFEHKYIELFSELDLRAKVATLKIDFDIAVAKSITAGGGDQQCWSLLFSGKQRDGSTPAIILRISSILSAIALRSCSISTWSLRGGIFLLFSSFSTSGAGIFLSSSSFSTSGLLTGAAGYHYHFQYLLDGLNDVQPLYNQFKSGLDSVALAKRKQIEDDIEALEKQKEDVKNQMKTLNLANPEMLSGLIENTSAGWDDKIAK